MDIEVLELLFRFLIEKNQIEMSVDLWENELLKKHNLNVNKCYLIGDRESDILAAQKVGCKSIFIERNYAETKPKAQIKTVKSFAEASKYIIKQS
jgi:histidinol phosphatase-like enzyme